MKKNWWRGRVVDKEVEKLKEKDFGKEDQVVMTRIYWRTTYEDKLRTRWKKWRIWEDE